MPPDEPRPPIPAPQGQHKASGNLTPALVSLRRLSHAPLGRAAVPAPRPLPATMDRVRRLVATLTERLQQVGCGLGRGRRRVVCRAGSDRMGGQAACLVGRGGMIATATRLVVDG
jgi:hypothetical protein